MNLICQTIREYLNENHPGWTTSTAPSITLTRPSITLTAPPYIKYAPYQPQIILSTESGIMYSTYTGHTITHNDYTLLTQITKMINYVERL